MNVSLVEDKYLLNQQAKVHQELNKRLLEQHGMGKCRKIDQPENDHQPERMSITNAVVTEFFRKITPK